MKTKTIYCCGHCNFESSTALDTETHEGSHYGLSLLEYREWKCLKEITRVCGVRVSSAKNKQTEAEFDKAIQDLINFEKLHNVRKVL